MLLQNSARVLTAYASPFSEERHSLLQRHGHLLPLHLAADAVRDVLPRVPPQVDIYCTYCGWCRYLHTIYASVEPGKPKNWTRMRLFIVNVVALLFIICFSDLCRSQMFLMWN